MQKPLDLRSDTLTLPTSAMLRAMTSASVGDDVWNEDETVKQLEDRVAKLAGKHSGLFVPSGTMSNLIAIICSCQLSPHAGPPEVIVGASSHIASYESGGSAVAAGVYPLQLQNSPNGEIPIGDIEAAIAKSMTRDVHFTATKLVCLENTHNKCGGVCLSLEYCQAVRALIDRFNAGILFHCDGARLWNAAVKQGQSIAQLCGPFDSVSLCLSKGLGAPVGSVLVGSEKFIALAKRYRKLLGGGMRQSGLLAAAGLFALDRNYARLAEDHATAQNIGAALSKAGFDVLPVHTNIVIWRVPGGVAAQFCAMAAAEHGVKLAAMGPDLVRAVPHLGSGNAQGDVERLLKACVAVRGKFGFSAKL